MTLAPKDAERLLYARYVEPAKSPTKYVVGFHTPTGKVLAIHRTVAETMVWFQPPEPPRLDGVDLQSEPNNGNHNINGPLTPLSRPDTLRARIDSATALNRFLDWYDGVAASDAVPTTPRPTDFAASYAHFQDLVTQKSGEPFTRFDEGLIAAWESYKPRVRDYALELLAADQWTEDQIGSGEILGKVISAIEIQATHGDRTNNMVFWQNRFGHAQRDHRALLDAERDERDKQRFERLFFDLYRSDHDEGAIFEGLRDLSDGKYPLLAYLFFLKDMGRFMPIQPTGFDRVFSELGIELKTLRNCSWENYQTFNAVLNELRGGIERQTGLKDVRLIDAHSFCWLFSTLLRQAANGELASGGKINERHLGAREKSIADIKYSVNKTVFNSNGQVVPRTVKEKELRMSDAELDKRIRELLEIQGDRCAITGLPFQFQGAHEDSNMLPSLDRIDSNGHYEASNVQLVCRFINFWKQASDDAEFRRLMHLVQGVG
ncbi:hypothetical protein [Paracoccus seriniphilus]|uniref:Uncharacterized protein n=1 Tax=Paracoccus seriniphilus TaxID=184748 RepID=A0A239Q3N3_9RHOB|nr:hypothetical protein [Paracoccus seriniphilus]SNT76802.1 hypothetical protein SAMN05444959_1291 [Paracoccus seriniphilus]